MKLILDRRTTKGNSSENRQKFLKKVRNVIRDSMEDAFYQKSIKDLGVNGQDIKVDKSKIGKSLDEPEFTYDRGGDEKFVIAGNEQFSEGDLIGKPSEKSGGGSGAGKGGSDAENGQDPFIIHITQEEFLNFFFDDLELPDLIKRELSDIEEYKNRNAGYTSTGSPSKLSIVRSMKRSLMRRFALKSAIKDELSELDDTVDDEEVKLKIQELKDRIESVPYLETVDLRYKNTVRDRVPSTSATMICIMDNSGSMGQREKTLSRKFFFLLYLFLNKKYKKIDLIFIHHTTEAKRVTEEEFFNMRETGGTVVSSALELTEKIIKEENLSRTNLYICQCSDGDNSGESDNQKCVDYLNNSLLKVCQYYSYIQIQPESVGSVSRNTGSSSLWTAYAADIQKKNFAQQLIYEDKDIFKVFRQLFEKKTSSKG